MKHFNILTHLIKVFEKSSARSCVSDIKYQCMGSWIDKKGNVFAAVADLGTDIYRERFRCLVSVHDAEIARS